ncbi:MAG TPA: hypothetical protein VGR35_06565 [Tepidisphaeraceae bacterium]|nr:hypothetical protein [Tepidisphaeraceae bacterium]
MKNLSQQHPPSPRRRRCAPVGFTLAELIIGLLLLAIIGGAAAALASAVTRGWQLGEATHTSSLTIARTMLRVQDKMQKAKATGEWRPGSVSDPKTAPGAAILLWRDDPDGDGRMQLEETQLLEYEEPTKCLVVWEVEFPDAVTRTVNNGPFPKTMLSDANAINDYKALKHVKKYAITRNVLGAQFNLINPTTALQRPMFEFRLKFNGANGQTVEYGTASPRARDN